MERLIKLLIDRLSSKGIEVTSIPAYIRNFAHTLIAHPSMSLEELNTHLQALGWDDFELDNDTFYLILATFEPINWIDSSFDLESLKKPNGEKEKVRPLQRDSIKPLEE